MTHPSLPHQSTHKSTSCAANHWGLYVVCAFVLHSYGQAWAHSTKPPGLNAGPELHNPKTQIRQDHSVLGPDQQCAEALSISVSTRLRQHFENTGKQTPGKCCPQHLSRCVPMVGTSCTSPTPQNCSRKHCLKNITPPPTKYSHGLYTHAHTKTSHLSAWKAKLRFEASAKPRSSLLASSMKSASQAKAAVRLAGSLSIG